MKMKMKSATLQKFLYSIVLVFFCISTFFDTPTFYAQSSLRRSHRHYVIVVVCSVNVYFPVFNTGTRWRWQKHYVLYSVDVSITTSAYEVILWLTQVHGCEWQFFKADNFHRHQDIIISFRDIMYFSNKCTVVFDHR